VTVFSAPQNVTLEELRLESWFPLDDATAELASLRDKQPPPMATKQTGNRSKKKLKSRAKVKRGVLKRGRVRRRKAAHRR